ncbi:MAG TPA: DUF177 domain-containing protein [Polyangiaceae bacterium]|nr:DUF177 domain-containing protein [Polyangiaceae bacterium]
MVRAEFVIPLADLDNGPKVADFAIPEPWLARALEGTDAVPRGEPGRLHVELAKNGREVLVRGHAEVAVSMPCVVTLDPLPFDLRPEILLLLSPAAAQSTAKRKPGGAAAKGKAAPKEAGAAKKGKSRGKRPWDDEPELSSRDAARDHFSGDQLALDEFVREFIVLELPMYPRRKDLPSAGDAAIGPAPEPEAPASIDPRLKPLAELAKRLGIKAENKE